MTETRRPKPTKTLIAQLTAALTPDRNRYTLSGWPRHRHDVPVDYPSCATPRKYPGGKHAAR